MDAHTVPFTIDGEEVGVVTRSMTIKLKGPESPPCPHLSETGVSSRQICVIVDHPFPSCTLSLFI